MCIAHHGFTASNNFQGRCCRIINIFAPGLIQVVREQTAGLHVALRGNFSGLVSATDLVKSSKGSASLVVCTQKKFLVRRCIFL